ncbi:PqqD family peptide modification chaperone [Agromyces neolithicus]|uniref:PqqD family protein n=1 Tax=Agromyces neolithicus TaxID=269420 RepID=A0ABN2LUN7_9MICO
MTGLRRAPGIGIQEQNGAVYVAPLPDGPIVVLDGVAGVIWHAACAGDRATIAERVAEATDAAADEIRDDVDAFVADLVARGLLVYDP